LNENRKYKFKKEINLNLTLLDKSNYLKGLLIIARKDNQLAESEKKILKSISEKLGFSSDFYEETIQNLLFNKHIDDEPIKFSNEKIAESFISDGIKLALSDDKLTESEISWLKNTALVNGVSEEKFEKYMNKSKETPNQLLNNEYALFSII
jgi:uncharacterized tellurite resistance protein B-like protein